MTCPRCGGAMQQHTVAGHLARPLVIDLCEPCQSFWFDGYESLQLSPGATLALFRVIGEHASRTILRDADAARCPRCRARLRRTRDMQRATRFEYFRCPNGHGRLIAFVEFLKEKDFVKPLSPAQIAELRQHVQTVNCSNCGGPIDLAAAAACPHCGSPLSMFDFGQADRLVEQLRDADERGAVSPTLPIDLLRARRDVEAALADAARDRGWYADVSALGLVGAGLKAVARWLRRDG